MGFTFQYPVLEGKTLIVGHKSLICGFNKLGIYSASCWRLSRFIRRVFDAQDRTDLILTQNDGSKCRKL